MTITALVLKFGSSALQSPDDIPAVMADIESGVANDGKVIVVVSAFEGVTNELIAAAKQAGYGTDTPDYARMIGAGELASATALTSALMEAGLSAQLLAPAAFGFIAVGPRDDATPMIADRMFLLRALEDNDIVIVPGFSAVDRSGDPILLGRGGSDISAIFLARVMGCRSVRLVKDVGGLYDRDPNLHENAKLVREISWTGALNICNTLIQHKALRFAMDCDLNVEIAAMGRLMGTVIGHNHRR